MLPNQKVVCHSNIIYGIKFAIENIIIISAYRVFEIVIYMDKLVMTYIYCITDGAAYAVFFASGYPGMYRNLGLGFVGNTLKSQYPSNKKNRPSVGTIGVH